MPCHASLRQGKTKLLDTLRLTAGWRAGHYGLLGAKVGTLRGDNDDVTFGRHGEHARLPVLARQLQKNFGLIASFETVQVHASLEVRGDLHGPRSLKINQV